MDDFVAALRAQNRVALGRLYDEHVGAVSSVIWKVLGGHREHEDLVQETFCQALAGIGRYRGDEHGLRPWLVQIAVRRCYRTLRYQRLRRWLQFSPPEELPVKQAVGDDPHVSLVLRRVYEVLEGMPADERMALSLRMLVRMTVPEIVDAMGIPRSTVKRLIQRSRDTFLKRAKGDLILSQWAEGMEGV